MKSMFRPSAAFLLVVSLSMLVLVRPAAAQSASAPAALELPAVDTSRASLRTQHGAKPMVHLEAIELTSTRVVAHHPKPGHAAAKSSQMSTRPIALVAIPLPKAAPPAPRTAEDDGLVDLVERSPHRAL